MIVIETENSRYDINDAEDAYRRVALQGGQPVSSPRLEYDCWLPLKRWNFKRGPSYRVVLRLFAPDSFYGIITSDVLSVKQVNGVSDES